MNAREPSPASSCLDVSTLFEPPPGVQLDQLVRAGSFSRRRWAPRDHAVVLLDGFRDFDGVACSFIRLAHGSPGGVRFCLEGLYGLNTCPSGGWLLEPTDGDRPTYWIPRNPILRRYDAPGRILSEAQASLLGAGPASTGFVIDVETRADAVLELVVWRLARTAASLVDELKTPLVIEQQPIFMLSSHTSYCRPADVYLFLLHGAVYENRFDFKTKRKICSELEAYALYLALVGLEGATGKSFYRLLQQQIVGSVIARQEADGGWRHGEWSDFMETHFRFQSAAVLMLSAELERAPDASLRGALSRAAAFLAGRFDRTAIGVWFLHDSLEESEEQLTKSGARWVASTELGKAPATKMILNTHLDTTVALDRYRESTGDNQYVETVASAVDATRALLALRPAEPLYRALYWAVNLTLLPAAQARRLAPPLRVIRWLTRRHVIPRLHRVKRRFPRMVMPGGLIERHLSRLHFGLGYHTVNIADLTRVLRRFPTEDFGHILDGGVGAVVQTPLLDYWGEARQLQPVGYWAEALYHLCTLRQDLDLRRSLAQSVLRATDLGLGLPPSLLGFHPESGREGERRPCPSPADRRLRVANLSCHGRTEILAVNTGAAPVELEWERFDLGALNWRTSSNWADPCNDAPGTVPARGWVLGYDT